MNAVMELTPIQEAVRKAGSQVALAKYLGVKAQQVQQWYSGTRPLPAVYVLDIERFTGISRHKLRPDVFGARKSAY